MYLFTIFLRKRCYGSKKWSWLIQWMISNLRALSEELLVQTLTHSTQELLQHWTKSSRIPASRKWSVWRKWKLTMRIGSFMKTDRLHNLRILPWAKDSVENYADLLTIVLRNDDIQEFDSKWSGILLSITQIPPDDILEGLYKLRIRESEKLKTVLELYNMEIHQKKLGPDYHRLKTMVKRSIEQNLRMKNFEARNGHFETSVVVKNQGVKQREQRSLGDCWHWKANGQCSKGDNCSFQHDKDKRAKSTQPNPSPRSSTQQNERKASRTRSPRGRRPSGKMVRLPCKDYLKGTCINSTLWKMAPSRMFVLQIQRVVADLGKSARMHIVRLMNNSLAKGPKRMVTKVQ